MTTQINQLTELTTTSDDDLILIREAATGVDKRMKAQNIRAKATTKADVGLGNVDNVSAADLRDRSTHTGTQPMSTISDAGTAATADTADLLDRANHTGTQTLATISDAGTIASQDADDVAITGGTIDGATIGATTASTGAFTTASASTSLTTPFIQIATAGDGIKFGTRNNNLDDYEEGTFTPTITDVSGNPASGYGSIREGRYVKIGKRVFIWCSVAKNGSVGMNGGQQARITGLPFTNRPVTAGWFTPLAVGLWQITHPAGVNGFFASVASNASFADVSANVNNNTTAPLTVGNWGDGVNNSVHFSGFYETIA